MNIPEYVKMAKISLENKGFEAYIVGGCVRDILMGKIPKDWDLTTNARPEQILEIFPNSKYENDFGTVILPIRDEKDEVLDVLEITTYRSETGYSNRRHPDEIKFEDKLEMDLSRRDFTVNALAMKDAKSKIEIEEDLHKHVFEIDGHKIVDLFGGRKDLKAKIIRAVGEPSDRFKEDALRMMRAIRFSAQLNFEIEPKTQRAITKLSGSIKFISKERIKDELIKILSSEHAYEGMMKLFETKMLQYIIPELANSYKVEQNRHHTFDVFKHSMMSLKHCPSKDWRVRMASMLHDIGKPKTKKFINGEATFYNHEYVGAKMVVKIMQRLKFSNEDVEKVRILIVNHMFYYNVDEVTASSVRRLMRKVGDENLKDLIKIRIADRLGSGVPKAKPYKIRHLEYMFDKVKNDPVSVKMLKVNGEDVMKILKINPGPKVGAILDVILSEVIEEPELNKKDILKKRVKELNELDLEELRKRAKEAIEEKRDEDDKQIKKKHWVK